MVDSENERHLIVEESSIGLVNVVFSSCGLLKTVASFIVYLHFGRYREIININLKYVHEIFHSADRNYIPEIGIV